jgi:large subunit ribosomal protein L10
MTREEKSKAITEIKDVLSQNGIIYLTDISGLNSIETSNLRRLCFKSGVKLEVMKNTLLEQAMTASDKDFGDLLETLKGNTSIMLSDVGNAPAKVIKDFRKKSERPILKGAIIENDIYLGDEQLELLSSIKSKEEIIGEIVILLQSPVRNIISALKSSSSKLSGIIQTLSNREEKSSDKQASTEAPTEETSTEASTEEASTEASTEEASTEASTEEASTEASTEEASTEAPTKVPTEDDSEETNKEEN